MSDLTKKRRVRSGHRGSATKSITRVEEQLASSTPDADKLALLQLSSEGETGRVEASRRADHRLSGWRG